MKIMSKHPKTGKLIKVGDFKDGVYTRKVKPEHYMFTLKSYGITEDVINTLESLDCRYIRLDTGTKILDSIFTAWLYNSTIRNYGHGKQRFLAVNKMRSI